MVDTTSLEPFFQALASPDPTPGGGATSAVAGALGCAQAQMVAALTAQNPRYEAVREEMQQRMGELETFRAEFLRLARADAKGYGRVAQALKMPRVSTADQEARERELAEALEDACKAPFAMFDVAGEALEVVDWLSHEGSSLAKSDVICAAALLTAAADGASATVLANTSWMKDRELAQRLEARQAHKRELVRLHGKEIMARVERELLA